MIWQEMYGNGHWKNTLRALIEVLEEDIMITLVLFIQHLAVVLQKHLL